MKQEERKQLMHQIAHQINACQDVVGDFRDRLQKLIRHRQKLLSQSAIPETQKENQHPPVTVQLPAPITFKVEAQEKIRERTNFSSETKAYVMTLGSRLKATLNISTLKAARLVSKELKINQRTVYSWLKNYS